MPGSGRGGLTAVLLVALMVLCSITADNSTGKDDKSLFNTSLQTRASSLSGVVDIGDIAGTTIIGEYVPPPSGNLGIDGYLQKWNENGNYELKLFAKDNKTIPLKPIYFERMYTLRSEGERFPETIIFDNTTPYDLIYSGFNRSNKDIMIFCDIDGNGIQDRVYTQPWWPDKIDPERPGRIQISFDHTNSDPSKIVNITGTVLDEEQRNYYIDIINSKGRDLLRIISDIIDISRIEAGDLFIKTEPVVPIF